MTRILTAASVALLFGLALCSQAAEPAAEAFFRPVPDRAQEYDAEGIYPQGRLFAFGFYATNAARAKRDGVTILGPYGTEANVAAARKYGLKCTYSIGLPMDFHAEKPPAVSPE